MDLKKLFLSPLFKRTTQGEQQQGLVASAATTTGPKAPLGPKEKAVKSTSSAGQKLPKWQGEHSCEIYSRSTSKDYLKHMYNAGPFAITTEACKYCGRGFLINRLELHESVCVKGITHNRGIFNSQTQRLSELEYENYHTPRWDGVTLSDKQESCPKKQNWRLEHENLLTTIRNAKQVQNDKKNKPRKLSLLPRPLVPNNKHDFIVCPYCECRFTRRSAGRHILFCTRVEKTASAGTRAPSR